MKDAPLPPDGSAPGGHGAWLTRRRFLWGCGLLAPVAALGTWASTRSEATQGPQALSAAARAEVTLHVQRAAYAATTGQWAQARAETAAALAKAPEHAPTLFVLACMAIEEGDVREAEGVLARLKHRAPTRAEPLLLERLLAQRLRVPTPDWTRAFQSAWVEQGRPDFEHGHLLKGVDLDTPVDEVSEELWRDTASPAARVVLTIASRPLSPARARWLIEQVPGLEDPGMFVAVFNVLIADTLPTELRAPAAAALRPRLAQLAEAHPRSMQLQLLHRLAGTHRETPFTTQELKELEPLLTLPVWREFCSLDVFLEARAHLRAAGLADAGRHALDVVTLSVTDEGSLLLRKRAKVTRSHLLPGARERLGRVFHGVGTRLAEQSTLIERLLGLWMVSRGAEDMRADAEMMQADALLDEAHAAEASWRRAAFLRWPLRSLTEEMLEASARDELAYLRTFIA